jgi:hypothetical protein
MEGIVYRDILFHPKECLAFNIPTKNNPIGILIQRGIINFPTKNTTLYIYEEFFY